MNFVFNLIPVPFASYLSYFHLVWIWIRIHKVPEYGSNLDPDPDPQG